MADNKFSWYTIVHPDYEEWPAPLIYRLVGPAIEQSGETTCDIYYKENRKGGHTHNHVRNVLERKLNRSKESRTRCHNYLNKGFEYTLIHCNNHVFFRKQ